MAVSISQSEIDKIVSSIGLAEKNTSAEIFAVLCQRSGDYRFIGYALFLFWVLICSLLLALWLYWQARQWLPSPVLFAACQLMAALCGMAMLRFFPSLLIAIIPRRIAHEQAHRHAVSQYLAHGIHNTQHHNGVLVFVSLDEHYAEILVDTGIEEKLGRQLFLNEVELLAQYCKRAEYAQGYCRAISDIGAQLADAFPPVKGNPNELNDHLVIL